MGDGEKRKYNYSYDPTNRILKADFTQHNGSVFDNSAGLDFSFYMGNDGTDVASAYDANGNILKLSQKGWKVGGSSLIDRLTYLYKTNSNQLLRVTDSVNSATSKLGDFKDGTNSSDDYTYDQGGRMKTDNNKSISSILYTHLGMPYEVNITGKGKITYAYDNEGNKLNKVVTDNTITPARTTTWLYLDEFVYKNDTLQYFNHEEGMARADQAQQTGEATTFNFDYFLKDHLGNVRMVVTEELDTARYVTLSFEGAVGSPEMQIQDNQYENSAGASININTARVTRPGNFGTSGSNGTYAMLVRKSTGAIGGAKLLKVMSGDRIHTTVDFYYSVANATNTGANGIQSLLANFASALGASPQVMSVLKDGVSTITTSLQNTPALVNLLNSPNSTSGTNNAPKAYLNILFFDDQFKFDNTSSTAIPVPYLVNSRGTISRLDLNAVKANKNGYVYVYFSNETNEMVYFDNLIVTHEKGQILEETHYYPFGLTIAGLSSRSIQKLENQYGYNGKELQAQEFGGVTGLDWYDYGARMYDGQTGRWLMPDQLSTMYHPYSPFCYVANNPVKFIDPTGMAFLDPRDTKVNSSRGTWGEITEYGEFATAFVSGVQEGQLERSRIAANFTRFGGGDPPGKKSQNQTQQKENTERGKNLKKLQPIRDINNYLFGSAGVMYGSGEYIIAHNFDELVSKISSKIGFSRTNVGRALSGVKTTLKKGGKILFWLSSAVSAYDGYSHLKTGNYIGATKSGVDIAMGVVGLAGPIGFAISGVYFIVDQTVGWDTVIQEFQESTQKSIKMCNCDPSMAL